MADVVEYIFSVVPGCELTYRGFTEPNKTAEIDLVFRHSFMQSGLSVPQVTLLMECKNEARRITSEQVTRFATKLRDHNQTIGFMVSRTGLSGKGSTSGHGAIRQELSHGRTIVVLTLADIESLETTDDLIALCDGRRHELEVWRTYTSI